MKTEEPTNGQGLPAVPCLPTCDCLKKTDERLKEEGMKMDLECCYAYKRGHWVTLIKVKMLEGKKRPRIAGIEIEFCPFCGERFQSANVEALPAEGCIGERP